MKELNPFRINKDTPPSYENAKAKWYLIKKLEHVAGWKWESKEDERKAFLITKGEAIIKDCYNLFEMLDTLEFYERAYRDETT